MEVELQHLKFLRYIRVLRGEIIGLVFVDVLRYEVWVIHLRCEFIGEPLGLIVEDVGVGDEVLVMLEEFVFGIVDGRHVCFQVDRTLIVASTLVVSVARVARPVVAQLHVVYHLGLGCPPKERQQWQMLEHKNINSVFINEIKRHHYV